MNLYAIADFMMQKTCMEFRRFGHCGCKNKKGNPCQRTAELAKQCENGDNLDEVLKRVSIHKCSRHGVCNHKPCIKTEQVEEALLAIINRREAA